MNDLVGRNQIDRSYEATMASLDVDQVKPSHLTKWPNPSNKEAVRVQFFPQNPNQMSRMQGLALSANSAGEHVQMKC